MIRTYEDLLRTADAFTDYRTLIAGVELDLVTHLGKKSATAKEIARRADASPEGVEFLLNALTGIGLLTKWGERFRNTPSAGPISTPLHTSRRGNWNSGINPGSKSEIEILLAAPVSHRHRRTSRSASTCKMSCKPNPALLE